MQEQPSFPASLEPMFDDLRTRTSQGYDVHILCENLGHAERLAELVSEPCPTVTISIAFLNRGYVDRDGKRLFYAENQLFNRPHHHAVGKKFKAGQPLSGFDALSPGDYVVHIDHGIGRFTGIEHIKAEVLRDCMVVQYQDAAKLYVPIEDFHKVQKYVGKESAAPVLSKLGTGSWEKLKSRTRDSLKEMAHELIELYAKRQYFEGIQFSKDSVWQKEFEDAFVFEETPDQYAAIMDVKHDMESKKPMDRLVCGDVGFGKTEVALRAAFKAASDGYQVAVLAPTTILVAQHYETFRERLAAFPASVAMLSRFLGPKEQLGVVQKLKAGEVDIVIGTHRLLSKDIVFKNLGLLIIDEEQRFGVKHKEKLKQYRNNVDVLSMTATPIPRTLHLSLIGARDLSIINTPPANRLPIETHVLEYHDQVLRDAIENELDRGGQVYVVNNRIGNLHLLRDRIEQLVPRARTAVAHGQMDEKALEKLMKAFVAGSFDVLISTVIIESGLDIPNVNTILVIRSDAMGLSQLYQLRGRVGRSAEQAYAYLLTLPFKDLHDDSLKRLRALEQYTELGSGFQIAMRDLEIRGAGNILGHSQHGFISAVGFDLYCRLLKDAVDEIQGNKPKENIAEVKVDIAIEALIPPEYVPEPTARVSVYQQLAAATSPDTVSETEQSLVDRFGPLPQPVSSLLLLMRIKLLARIMGAARCGFGDDGILTLSFDGPDDIIASRIKAIFSASDRRFEVVYGAPVVCKTPLTSSTARDRAIEVLGLFEKITAAVSLPVSIEKT
jgi:transcription-repair coupling factor (superfamily II helicase)